MANQPVVHVCSVYLYNVIMLVARLPTLERMTLRVKYLSCKDKTCV